jgi:hypothetical protein
MDFPVSFGVGAGREQEAHHGFWREGAVPEEGSVVSTALGGAESHSALDGCVASGEVASFLCPSPLL